MLRLVRKAPVTYENLLEAVRSDQPTFAEAQEGWETQNLAPEVARTFTDGMFAASFAVATATARLDLFAGVRRLLDVGGGSGSWSIALALRHPEIRCIVLDLPAVCPVAEEYIGRYGVQERVSTEALDMFAGEWPAGHDAAFFGQIFHDWDPARCARLAHKACTALPSGGRVFLNEMVLGDGKDGPPGAVGMSLGMLMWTRGKQYTAQEFSAMLSEAGFVDIVVTPTFGYWSLVSARKP